MTKPKQDEKYFRSSHNDSEIELNGVGDSKFAYILILCNFIGIIS